MPLLRSHKLWQWGALSVLFIVVHGWLFIWYRQWLVLGYDTGFYRRYVLEPFTSLPHASVPGLDHTVIFPRIVLDVVRLFGFSTDVTLYVSYILVMAFCVGAFAWWVRSVFSAKTAWYAVVLIILSPLYFKGYWFFLMKNFLALGLWFMVLGAVRRHLWWLAGIGVLLIPVTHQTTSVLVGIMLALMTAIAWWRHDSAWSRLLFGWFVVTALYFLYHPSVAAKIAAPPVAVFTTHVEALLLMFPLLPILVWTITRYWRELISRTDLVVYLLVTLAFPLLQLPYYERVYVYIVFAIVAIVGFGLTKVRERRYVFVYMCIVALWGGYFMSQYEPRIHQSEEGTLQSLSTLPVDAQVLAANYLAPWLHGYTRAAVYAPGLFKDSATPEAWQAYWSHHELAYEVSFLNSFPQPLYIVALYENDDMLPVERCREQISPVLYRYSCYESTP